MKVKQILELNVQVHSICGWLGAGSANIESNVNDEGDTYMYVDIHQLALDKDDGVYDTFKRIDKEVSKLFGDKAKKITIFHNEESQGGYTLSINLNIS